MSNRTEAAWRKLQNQPVVLVVFSGHHRGSAPTLHYAIARVPAVVVKHYGGELSLDFK